MTEPGTAMIQNENFRMFTYLLERCRYFSYVMRAMGSGNLFNTVSRYR